jgi:Protein of unknown function (DUF4232)
MNRAFRIAGRAITGAALAAAAALTITSATPAARAGTAPASTPPCATSGLEAWLGLGVGGGAAGSTYYPMEFTNVTGHTCHLFGFPGVSAIYDGHQAGSPARWVASPFSPERTVTLAPGATAHTVLQIADVAAFPAGKCGPVTATALKVYPPGQFSATSIPFSFRACSAKGTIFMNVQYIQPGVGVPGYPNL